MMVMMIEMMMMMMIPLGIGSKISIKGILVTNSQRTFSCLIVDTGYFAIVLVVARFVQTSSPLSPSETLKQKDFCEDIFHYFGYRWHEPLILFNS